MHDAPLRRPFAGNCRCASARLARQHERLPAADGEGVELIGHRRALDEAMHLRGRKGSVGFGVAGQRIGANVGGINRLDHRREVGEHALSKRPWTRVLPHWAAGLAYPALRSSRR